MKSQDTLLKFKKEFIEKYKNSPSDKQTIVILENLYSNYKTLENQLINNFLLGYIKLYSKKVNEAKSFFDKALKIDNTFPLTLNCLGVISIENENEEEAISYYKKAIEIDSSFIFPWNNLGVINLNNSKYEDAIPYFEKAIKIDDKYAHPWVALGSCYFHLKQLKHIEEYFKKAMNISPNYFRSYYQLALFYESVNNYIDAQKYFSISLKMVKKDDDDNWWISTLQNHIKIAEKNIESNKILENKKKDDVDDPTFKILSETIDRGIEKAAVRNKKLFLDFLSEGSSTKNNQNYFQVLRRWNSYTPIIADNYHISKGGGYFLSLNSQGIVIDPGFNFIDNFKRIKSPF